MKNQDILGYPCAMTIAGSDSGGGAGIQADLRTFNAFGVFGCSAITALTAQNPLEVTQIEAVSAGMVGAQIDAVLSKICVSSIKTGMLFSAEIIRMVAEKLQNSHRMLVVDPVMVSTSGSRLLQADAVEVLKNELLPLADWITPNIPEAELLLNRSLRSVSDYQAAAVELAESYGCGVLLKTGHAASVNGKMVDIVAVDGQLFELGAPEVELPCPAAGHGTGCTLSSALAACLALEMELDEALTACKGFVYGSLLESVELGGDLYGMYPPQESYEAKTFLRPVKTKKGR